MMRLRRNNRMLSPDGRLVGMKNRLQAEPQLLADSRRASEAGGCGVGDFGRAPTTPMFSATGSAKCGRTEDGVPMPPPQRQAGGLDELCPCQAHHCRRSCPLDHGFEVAGRPPRQDHRRKRSRRVLRIAQVYVESGAATVDDIAATEAEAKATFDATCLRRNEHELVAMQFACSVASMQVGMIRAAPPCVKWFAGSLHSCWDRWPAAASMPHAVGSDSAGQKDRSDLTRARRYDVSGITRRSSS